MTDLFAFDLHGTLVAGNENALVEATNISLEEHGRKERLTIEDARRLQGTPWADIVKQLCQDASSEEIAKIVIDAKKNDSIVIPKHTRLMDHARETLEKIKSDGNKTLIVSSTTPEVLDLYFKHLGITGLVDCRVGISDVEENMGGVDIGRLKGRKLRAYVKRGNFGRVVMTGDTEDDVKAGKIAHATTIYINSNGLKSDIADYSIENLRQFMHIWRPAKEHWGMCDVRYFKGSLQAIGEESFMGHFDEAKRICDALLERYEKIDDRVLDRRLFPVNVITAIKDQLRYMRGEVVNYEVLSRRIDMIAEIAKGFRTEGYVAYRSTVSENERW